MYTYTLPLVPHLPLTRQDFIGTVLDADLDLSADAAACWAILCVNGIMSLDGRRLFDCTWVYTEV